jgi:hypothetical protein
MARLPSRSGGSKPAFAHWASAWHLRSSAAKAGGADRDRTDDLKLAKLALSQLSYGPGKRQTVGVSNGSPRRSWEPAFALSGFGAAVSAAAQRSLVGPGRVERPTSRLSGVRSNHLSYEPETRIHGVSGSLRQVNRKTQATMNTPMRACDLGIRRKEGKRRRRHVRQCLKEMFGFGVRPLRKHHP